MPNIYNWHATTFAKTIGDDTMTKSKLETAKHLAKEHFRVEPELRKIFLLEPFREEDPREPIKLLEVVEGAIERGVEPIAFPSNSAFGVPFPSVIVELSPREFEDLKCNKLYFGDESWKLGAELFQ